MINDTALTSLYIDFAKVKETLRGLAKIVINQEISEYPIFIASAEWVQVGKPIFDREEVETNWFFFVSILEEFTKKKLLLKDQIATFKQTYADPETRACIFLIDGNDGRFVFVPYDAEMDETELEG